MKLINFDVELKSTSVQRQFTREKAMTNDLNSVDINYKILDMAAEDLTDATAQVLLYMQDGSFFQVPNEKITLAGTTFTYALEEAPGNHAGIVRTQIVVKTADLKEYASPKLEFEIVSGLETQVATEVMIHDWTTLTREARAYIDAFAAAEVERQSQFDNAQTDRTNQFNAVKSNFEGVVSTAESQVEANILETAVEEKFDGLEAEYATDLTQVKTQLAETQSQFDNAVGAITADSEVVLARDGKTTLKERLDNEKEDFIQHKLDYTEYLASELGQEHIRRKLPNGIGDKIILDKKIQMVQSYVLKASNIIDLYQLSNVDQINIQKPVNSIGYNDVTLINWLTMQGYTEFTGVVNNTSNIGKLRLTTDGLLFSLVVAKGTYPTLTDAKNALAGTVINYQLKAPQEILLPSNMTPNTLEIVRLNDEISKLKNYNRNTCGGVVYGF